MQRLSSLSLHLGFLLSTKSISNAVGHSHRLISPRNSLSSLFIFFRVLIKKNIQNTWGWKACWGEQGRKAHLLTSFEERESDKECKKKHLPTCSRSCLEIWSPGSSYKCTYAMEVRFSSQKQGQSRHRLKRRGWINIIVFMLSNKLLAVFSFFEKSFIVWEMLANSHVHTLLGCCIFHWDRVQSYSYSVIVMS